MISVGVIGCGRWGQNLIRVFNEQANLIICCNKSDGDRLDQLKSLYPQIDVTHDISEVLGDSRVEAVIIATPDETHVDIARNALLYKKHVFVEKPLAFSFGQAEELVNLAKAQGKILMTGHIMQYHPCVQWMKERIISNPLDTIQTTRSELSSGLDLLWSSAIHDISVIQYLLDAEPQQINAKQLLGTLYLSLVFSSGVRANMRCGFTKSYRERRIVLQGSQETVIFDGLTGKLELFIHNRAGRVIEMPSPQEPLTIECQHFLDCIKMNTTPLSGGENALLVIRTLDKIDQTLGGTR